MRKCKVRLTNVGGHWRWEVAMTVSNTFGPFGFNRWTAHDTDGGDDAADEVQLGEKNTLSGGDAGTLP